MTVGLSSLSEIVKCAPEVLIIPDASVVGKLKDTASSTGATDDNLHDSVLQRAPGALNRWSASFNAFTNDGNLEITSGATASSGTYASAGRAADSLLITAPTGEIVAEESDVVKPENIIIKEVAMTEETDRTVISVVFLFMIRHLS